MTDLTALGRAPAEGEPRVIVEVQNTWISASYWEIGRVESFDAGDLCVDEYEAAFPRPDGKTRRYRMRGIVPKG